MANWCYECARKPYIGCDAECPIFGKHLEDVAEDYFKLQADAVEVVRCKDCGHHERCHIESLLVDWGIENPYCCIGELEGRKCG